MLWMLPQGHFGHSSCGGEFFPASTTTTTTTTMLVRVLQLAMRSTGKPYL